MTIVAFLGLLRERGIELRADGDKLVVNAPKGVLTEELAAQLRDRKAELLGFLRTGAAASSGRAGARIGRARLVERDGGALEAPLSFGQRRLFYLDQLEPGLAVYNVPVACWITGALDIEALRGALDDVAARHAVLRTTLRFGVDGPVQHIAPSLAIDLAIVDLTELADAGERERRCRQALTEHACRAFDLAVGPLFRAVLVKLTGNEQVLLAAMHHVVTDGWSQDVLERDLLAFYEARRGGAPAALPALDIQYADYAIWQGASTDDPDRARRIAYWQEALRQPLTVLELPTMRSRGQMAPTAGDIASIELPLELVELLGAIGRRDGATLFMVLLACYATLLHRITGQDEVIIGTPIANRNHTQTLDLVGYFANTLALRIDLSGAPSVRELVIRVRDVCVGAYENQDIPFEELVEKLGVTRDLGRSPVFQTIFAFEDARPHAQASAASGADAARSLRIDRRESIHAKVARTDLSTWVSATPAGLRITFEYPTALFDDEGIRDLLDQFGVLLRAVAGGDEGTIDRLPLLSSAQRTRILETWNDTARPLPDVRGAHQLIERQVDATPDRIAVVFGTATLTYRELDQRANRLAHHLIALGAAPGAFVGVFFERSETMLVALLATLKLGGTYVPLDPEYPAERVAMMIEDSKLGFILTTASSMAKLPPSSAAARVVAVDRDAAAIAARPADRLAYELTGEHPCYAIYTSGSTGKPNGVLVPHRALVSFLASMAVRPGLDADDTLVAVTTLSFDIAGLEMFLPLTVGAKLVIAGTEQVRDARQLRALLERSGATVMQATPATWRLLLSVDWQGRDRFKVLCGGEAFPPDLAAALLERTSGVWNMYGPTETTIWSTCVELTRADPRITIGRPIDNTSVYVLDALGQPVPVGTPGELVIGGVGVSLGYLGRPELTAKRFVPDPFRGGGALMYRTGDVATWRGDGHLVYQRRVDHQVKLRGYRIELGEIEAVLGEHPAVERCVVIVREDRPGDARVAAYVILRAGKTLTPSEVRKHLRKKLPEFMIPQHVVELTAFPLTPAGKLARAALPVPAGAVPAPEARAPQTPAELVVAKIWKDLLHVDRVAATDNFFEIGGHSLLSMAVVARIQAETGSKVSLRDLLLQSLEQIAQGIGT